MAGKHAEMKLALAEEVKIDLLLHFRRAVRELKQVEDLLFDWPTPAQKETAAVAPDAA